MSITVVVGDVGQYLANYARDRWHNSRLLDNNYWPLFVQQQTNVQIVYTSLGDLSLSRMMDVLNMASHVVYHPPKEWSDGRTLNEFDPTASMQGLTENLLLMCMSHTLVENSDLIQRAKDLLPPVAERHSDQPQLWCVGCSVTYGVGVTSAERYANLLAKQLAMPCSVLAALGASNSWAADQLLRSDIRAGDIVIWGITGLARQTVISEGKCLHMTVSSFNEQPMFRKIWDLSHLTSETCAYMNRHIIKSVTNVLKIIKCQLIMFNALADESQRYFLQHTPDFYWFSYPITTTNDKISSRYIDFGNDHIHPGPLQHQAFAHHCLTNIKL